MTPAGPEISTRSVLLLSTLATYTDVWDLYSLDLILTYISSECFRKPVSEKSWESFREDEKYATDLKCLAMSFHYLNSSEFSIQPGEGTRRFIYRHLEHREWYSTRESHLSLSPVISPNAWNTGFLDQLESTAVKFRSCVAAIIGSFISNQKFHARGEIARAGNMILSNFAY